MKPGGQLFAVITTRGTTTVRRRLIQLADNLSSRRLLSSATATYIIGKADTSRLPSNARGTSIRSGVIVSEQTRPVQVAIKSHYSRRKESRGMNEERKTISHHTFDCHISDKCRIRSRFTKGAYTKQVVRSSHGHIERQITIHSFTHTHL